ncbi:acyltransferase family protein [Sphingobacterium deserti]|uniref:Acyltransferase 3 n=1 Tax=Sphingobacterium deserti TaxID=1229276 RepID=A0A0B8T747_9SPHI|nr:acyltransferase [Sphingobacterium deserti]KGE14149.1 acyltransferase 3 [Sphingobacterium deserti]
MKGKINSLQIIRAYAAILVVICHIWNDGWLNNALVELGGFGVDLFFVLSGFIMSLTVKLNLENRSINAFHFLSKRVVRIFPIYIICAIPLLLFDVKAEGVKSPFFYIGNIFLLPSINADWPYRLVLGPGWTLVYEMIFYYIFALTMLFTICKEKLLLIVGLAVLAIVGMYQLFNLQSSQGGWVNLSYILGDTLMLNFVLGIVCFRLYELWHRAVNLDIFSAFIVLLAVSILAAYLYSECKFPRFVAYGLPAFIVVSFFTLTQKGFAGNRIISKIIYIGDASYSIYLTHYYFAFFKPKLISSSTYFNVDFDVFLNALDFLLVIGAVIGGCLFYNRVEKPIIRYTLKKI